MSINQQEKNTNRSIEKCTKDMGSQFTEVNRDDRCTSQKNLYLVKIREIQIKIFSTSSGWFLKKDSI